MPRAGGQAFWEPTDRSPTIRILSYIAVLLAVTLLAGVAGYALLSAWTWPPGPTAETVTDPEPPAGIEVSFGGFPAWPQPRASRFVEARSDRGGRAGLPERSGTRSLAVRITGTEEASAGMEVAVLAADGQPLERLAGGPGGRLQFEDLPDGPLQVALLRPGEPARTRWLTAAPVEARATEIELVATVRAVRLELRFEPARPGSADAARRRAVTPRLTRVDAPHWLAPHGAAPTQMVDRAGGGALWELGPLGLGRYRLDFDGFVPAEGATLEFEITGDRKPQSLQIAGRVPGPTVPASAPDLAGEGGLPGRGPRVRNERGAGDRSGAED